MRSESNFRSAVTGLTAAAAILIAASVAPGETGFLDRSVTVNGDRYRYQVYVPVDWTKEKTWPVTVYLHGNGNQGIDGVSHTVSGIGNAIRRRRMIFPTIVVMPQAQPNTRWSTATMQAMVLATIDGAIREFNGDADRVYLAGFSMGGQGTARIGARFPDRFAALVMIAGRFTPHSPRYTAEQIDEDIRGHTFLQPDAYEGTAKRIAGLPSRVFHGDADSTVTVDESRRLVAALKAVGANTTYTEYPSLDHVPTADKALSDPELWSWLLAQRRKKGNE